MDPDIDRMNFDTLDSSVLTVFALVVNEDWNYILYKYARGTNWPAYVGFVYILSVVFIGNFLLL